MCEQQSCPWCNKILINLEHFNTEYDGIETVTLDFSGQCPKCKREYTWEEKFLSFEQGKLEELN